MDEIRSIEDIQRLVTQGFKEWKRFGNVSVKISGDLILFNYTTMAQFDARWNFFEQVSRGLILNRKTGEIVARPFDKFFNWLEGGRRASGHMVTITEKVDGSLGILYRTPDGYRIATRGHFISKQAEWATRFLNENYDLTGLPDELTLLFEIVYPDNRVVINYEDREDLVLLAARNRHTGAYLPFFPDVYTLADQYGFSIPQVYQFAEITEIIAKTGEIDVNHEGYVVEFSDGTRFKFKGDRYKELQRVIMGLTFKNVLKAMSSGSLQTMLDTVPDEFLPMVKGWTDEIQATIDSVKAQMQAIFASAPRESRKEFANWVHNRYSEYSAYLFALYDEYELAPIIYRTHDWQYQDKEMVREDETFDG